MQMKLFLTIKTDTFMSEFVGRFDIEWIRENVINLIVVYGGRNVR